MRTFEKHIVVSKEDLDNLNHVNNVRFVQWVQDIAEQHWKSKVSNIVQETYFWVLMKHTIEYKSEAILGDSLKLVTYVRENTNVTSTRIVEIYNEKTNKLIVNSETVWCFMSAENKRPTRIITEVFELFN